MEACAWVHLDGEATRRAMISWQVHLYGEAARFFFPLIEQVHLYGEATQMDWGTLYSLVCCMTNVTDLN